MDDSLPSLRLVDLAPRRGVALAGLLAAGAAAIAGLELLYVWMLRLKSLSTDGSIAAFDLDREGSLAAWFSSTLLISAALASWLVYHIRRGRADDYQARYRIWLWAGLCWFVMGVDEAASLHEGFKEMLVHLTGMRVVGDGSVWWMAAYLLVLLPLGLRLVLDMRGSRLALAAFFGAGASYALAAVAQLEWLPGLSIAASTMVEEGAEMAGDLLLFWAMLAHARHLLLGGQSAPTASRKRRARRAAQTIESEEVSTPATDREPAAPASGAIRRADPPAAAAQGPHRMSKAERKALRRQSRAERDDWN